MARSLVRRVSAAAMAVAGMAAMTACGSGSTLSTSAPAGQVLTQAASTTRAVPTGRFDVTVTAQGVPQLAAGATTSMTATGEFDQTNRRAHLSGDAGQFVGAALDAVASGALGRAGAAPGGGSASAATIPPELRSLAGKLAGPTEVVVDGRTVYVRSGLLALLGGGAKPWVSMTAPDRPAAGAPDTTMSTVPTVPALTPDDVLGLLGRVANDATVVGSDDVRGTRTTHYRGTLDLAAATRDLPADQRDRLDQALARAGGLGAVSGALAGVATADVWVAGDGTVRRVSLRTDLDALSAGAQKLAPSTSAPVPTTAGTLTVTVELYDLGASVDVTPPPADQVTDGAALLGGLGGFGRPR